MRREEAAGRLAAAIEQGANVVLDLFDTSGWGFAVQQQFINTLVGAYPAGWPTLARHPS